MTGIDFSKVKTSWTKYDIVLVMEVISSVDKIQAYKAKEIVIDEPILRSFLGIKSLKDPIPAHWLDIQRHPSEKRLFALLAVLFTHGEIIEQFANKYANDKMGGIFSIEEGKMYTNIRSAVVEAGAALSNYRREDKVPYDLAAIYKNGAVGKLFKEVLRERLSRVTSINLNDEDFYEACYQNKFDKAIGVTSSQFKLWLEGAAIVQSEESSYIKSIQVQNFYSVIDIELDFGSSKEIYFLGENGDGKSLILMAIYLTFRSNFIRSLNNIKEIAGVIDMLHENPNFLPLGIDNSGKEYGIGKDLFLNNLYAYGTHRGRYSTDEAEDYGFMSLFDANQTLINPVTWLSRQKAIELEKSGNILVNDKVEHPLEIPVDFLEKMLNDILEKDVTIKVDVEKVDFVEKGANPISFNKLSEGYKSVIIFVCDLIFRLCQNAKGKQLINDLKAVVLVDEIDLHLHPKWQRVIIRKLRTVFPNVQFIFTTHSPTIIQGASEDAVIYRVYRNTKDGKTRVSEAYFRKDLDRLMVNTLVTSPLFGLDDSRLNPDESASDTNETYLLYRINRKLEETLAQQKEEGKIFISDQEIDNLIQQIINEELGKKND